MKVVCVCEPSIPSARELISHGGSPADEARREMERKRERERERERGREGTEEGIKWTKKGGGMEEASETIERRER